MCIAVQHTGCRKIPEVRPRAQFKRIQIKKRGQIAFQSVFFRAFKYCSYVVEPYNGFDLGDQTPETSLYKTEICCGFKN